jgi:hypothetical protein
MRIATGGFLGTFLDSMPSSACYQSIGTPRALVTKVTTFLILSIFPNLWEAGDNVSPSSLIVICYLALLTCLLTRGQKQTRQGVNGTVGGAKKPSFRSKFLPTNRQGLQ